MSFICKHRRGATRLLTEFRSFNCICSPQGTPFEGERILILCQGLQILTVLVCAPLALLVFDGSGGYFKIRFQFGADFPNQPPKCTLQMSGEAIGKLV